MTFTKEQSRNADLNLEFSFLRVFLAPLAFKDPQAPPEILVRG